MKKLIFLIFPLLLVSCGKNTDSTVIMEEISPDPVTIVPVEQVNTSEKPQREILAKPDPIAKNPVEEPETDDMTQEIDQLIDDLISDL